MTVASREDLIEEALAQMEVLGSIRRRAFCAHPPHRHVSLPQIYILTLIQEHGRQTVSDIAGLLAISVPSASSILDRMEEHGLVARVRDEKDRRVVWVEIAPHGRDVVEQVGGMHQEKIQGLLRLMTEEELQHLIQGVQAVASALERGTTQQPCI